MTYFNLIELDALGAELAYEESNEIPSYLQDNTAEFNPQPLPSFADELDELDRLQVIKNLLVSF